MKRWLLIVCCAVAAALFSGRAAIAGDPNISGKWKLNEQESEDPRQKFEEQMKEGGGMPGNRPGGGPPGMRRGGPGRGPMRGLFEASKEITIAYNEPEFTFTDSEGVKRSYYSDGRKFDRELPDGRKVAIVSRWEDDQLVIESKAPDGGSITETYYLSPDATRLYVKVRMTPVMMDKPITFIRVYDAVATEEPAAQQ